MGNKLDQQNDLESAEICPKAFPENIVIQRFSADSAQPTAAKQVDSNRFDGVHVAKRTLFHFRKKKNKRKNKPSKTGDPESIKSAQCYAESDAAEQPPNEPVQSGNGLVSLKNLNYYLESDTEFHLVNRILKRIGVFNRQTQTDFEPFSRECLQLIEVSQRLVDELESLNCERPTIEELEEEHQQTHNEGFNMVYCGRIQAVVGKTNTRNVNVQRCISRATVGTNTVQSIAHLTICSVLSRLGEFDEQVRCISKPNRTNIVGGLNGQVREANGETASLIQESIDQIQVSADQRQLETPVDWSDTPANDELKLSNLRKASKETEILKKSSKVTSNETSKETSKVNSPENNLDDYFWDSFEGCMVSAKVSDSSQIKRNSDTFNSDTFILNGNQFLSDPRSPINDKLSSQSVLSGQECSTMDVDGHQPPDGDAADASSQNSLRTAGGQCKDECKDECKEDCLESMDKQKLEEYLKNLLLQVQLSQEHQKKVKSRNAGVQTMNDIITDELPEYAARTPSLRKKELIYSEKLFEEVDKRTLEAPNFSQLNDLVDYLARNCENDIFKVRTLFRWITHNMSFDWRYLEEQHKKMLNNQIKAKIASTALDEREETGEPNSVIEEGDEEAYLKGECLKDECLQNEQNCLQSRIDTIYQTRVGGSKEFVELFVEMCKRLDIRCKLLQGFAKNYDYRPGHMFFEEDINNLTNVHHWLAVFVLGNWHLIDLTWATGYTDPLGKFQRKKNEFYFFTDPEQLIWSHFPFNKQEREYERWQLLDKPISLDNFNNLPKITPNWFEFNLKLRSKIANPINFKVQTEIKIASHEPLRYKFKLFHVDETENCSLNNFVFCQLKEDRLIASFVVCPPIEGRYYLKVYTKSEREMQEQKDQANASLNYILTMLLDCTKARKYQNPYPVNELPYGPVQAFYQYQMQLINQHSAIISTFGGKRKLVMQCNEPMLLTYQIIDADGQEQDTRTMINRDDENSTNVITLNILPPRVGMFKLAIFGAPRQAPNQRGKMRLPLLATFLIDCRLAKIVNTDNDPPPMKSHEIDNLGKKLSQNA